MTTIDNSATPTCHHGTRAGIDGAQPGTAQAMHDHLATLKEHGIEAIEV